MDTTEAGTLYRLRGRGTAHLPTPYWAFDRMNPANQSTIRDICDDNVTDAGISINGQPPDWGPYRSDHVYDVPYLGDGFQIKFRMSDSQPNNNTGFLEGDILLP